MENTNNLVVPEKDIKEAHGDPWQYYTDGKNFYTRKKGDVKWILAKGKAEKAIKEKIYNIITVSNPDEAKSFFDKFIKPFTTVENK